MQENIYSYQLGAMKLTIISEGTLKGSPSRVFVGINEAEWKPLVETDSAGLFTLGMNMVHLAVGDHSILLDTGLGEPQPARTTLDQKFPITQTASLNSCLASIGVQSEQMTTVLLSHADGDHIMGTTIERDGQRIPAYPNARYLLMQREWVGSPQRMDPASTFNFHLPVLRENNCLHLVDDDHEVAPGVRMISAPGESPGHAIIRLESMGKTAFYVGDLFHHTTEVIHLDWVWPGRDKAQMLASRQALVKEALETDAVLISAHMLFPGMGKLQQSHNGLDWVAIDPDS